MSKKPTMWKISPLNDKRIVKKTLEINIIILFTVNSSIQYTISSFRQFFNCIKILVIWRNQQDISCTPRGFHIYK